MANQELNSATYQPSGTYIGAATGSSSATSTEARTLALLGKGSRYKHEANAPIVRGYISNEQLSFAVATSGVDIDDYVATMDYVSNGKQSSASLVALDVYGSETTVLTDYWHFNSDNSGIVISAHAFDQNATYTFSYQSVSRTVGDIIATDDIRKIAAIGSGVNQNDYKRGVDYFVDTVVTEPTPALDANGTVIQHTNDVVRVTDVVKSNAAGAILTVVPSSAKYSRKYVFTATGTSGAFTYVATPTEAGNGVLPKTPVPVAETLTQGGAAVTVTDGDVTFTVAIASGAIVTGDTYTFTVLAPSFFEVASTLNNVNQFAQAGAVSHTGTGTGAVVVNGAGYVGKQNAIFRLRVSSITGGVTFQIATGGNDISIGNVIGADVTVLANGTATFALGLGVTAVLSSAVLSDYKVGDIYTFIALAPRTFAVALDDRNIGLTIGAVGAGTDYGSLTIKYAADTYEGGTGSLIADASTGYSLSLPGGIKLYARNVNVSESTAILNQNSHAVGDKWTVVYTNNDVIYWTLDKQLTESLTSSNLALDRNGSVTGTPGAYYVVLKHDVSAYASTLAVSLNGTALVAGTGFKLVGTDVLVLLTVTAKSDVTSLSVSYTYAGNEPTLGKTYYLTGDYLRPASDFNTPKLFSGIKAAQAWAAPYTIDNYLAIALDIAYAQDYTPPAVALVMVRDADDDGKFTKTDIQNALDGAAGVGYIKDFVPVGLGDEFTSLISAYNVAAHDPFEKREHFWYYGAPAGTPIGSETTEDSLVYTSRNTLQVSSGTLAGAHGSRIMLAPTTAKVQVTLDSGVTATPTVDGSFVAVALGALVCGQPNNSTSMLKQRIKGFKSIQTYNDTNNKIVGGANLIWLTDKGSSIYEIEEDVTTDEYAPHYHEILAMRMKQEATRYIRTNMDRMLIGYVPDTKAAGVAFIQQTLIKLLTNLVADGTIAPYQDENGNVRAVSIADIDVYRDEDDTELYHFNYVIYTRSTIKRLYGLYSVNENVFSAAA